MPVAVFMVLAGLTTYGQEVGYIFTDGGITCLGKTTTKEVNHFN